MKIDYLYAATVVKDIDASAAFYTRVLGREPDDRPMDTLVQWRGFSNAGIQLFKDPDKAGNSIMTLVVADMEATGRMLKAQGLALSEVKEGDFGKIAHLNDPDGNVLTFAEPPKGGHKNT